MNPLKYFSKSYGATEYSSLAQNEKEGDQEHSHTHTQVLLFRRPRLLPLLSPSMKRILER